MKNNSVYTDILVNRREPILFEDEEWFVLFAKIPCNEGHLLIIPKQVVKSFYKIPPDTLQRGFSIASKLSALLADIYNPPQVALFIKGFTNDDHAHIHIAPVYKSEDINKDPTRPELSIEDMHVLAQKLQPQISKTLATK